MFRHSFFMCELRCAEMEQTLFDTVNVMELPSHDKCDITMVETFIFTVSIPSG
jgi:hypothetical protein